MKKLFLSALVLAGLLTASGFTAAQEKQLTEKEKEEGWVSIFDGKTLDGWKSNEKDKEGFYVNDGCIVGKGDRNHLFYMEELGDFELKIDCKISKGGNSGLYVKSPWVDSNWPTGGFELQINSSHSDPVKTGSIYNILLLFEAPHGDGEWFTYYVTMKGDTMTVRVNDKVLYTYVDPVEKADGKPQGKITERNKRIRQQGHIALQQHDPESIPHFKNVFLKKL